ncbi:hypothetical protein AeMF1_013651 [Aphanomyces euteiches]|nr:hypothetical protein AeMF1_013651 [Aphanomyces euteiches]
MGSGYTQEHAYQLYLAYGVFPDWAWRNFTKPALTIEIVGTDFVAAASTIPARGLEVYKGINQFAKEVVKFNGAIKATIDDEKNGAEAATVQKLYYVVD